MAKGNSKNLTAPQYKSGQSGNLKGRPKGSGADAILRTTGEKIVRRVNPLTGKREMTTIDQAIADTLCFRAFRGDVRAMVLYYNRTQGSPIQKIETEPNEAMTDLNKIMREIQESNGNGNGTKRKTARNTNIRRTE